ncbi:hypothetical protein [Methylocaldum sp.]|jgi:hypothetical protein|uniref:hypothetical protein n=1 Tax=Methylocaldum sp. TaxID=1969727 RepID=UPI0032205DCB
MTEQESLIESVAADMNARRQRLETAKSETTMAQELSLATAQQDFDRAGYIEDRDDLNQLVGRVQMANVHRKFSDYAVFTLLESIHESKQYRLLKGKTFTGFDGAVFDAGTWEGFCRLCGTSASTFDEWAKNKQAIGEDAHRTLQQIGLTTRDFRQIRKLPDDDRKAIAEAVEAHAVDKDAILDLIDQLSTKHAKEKESLEKTVQRQKHQLEEKAEDISKKDAKLAELRATLEDLKRTELPPDEAELAALRRIQELERDYKAIVGAVELVRLDQASVTVRVKMVHLVEYFEVYARKLRTDLMHKYPDLWDGAVGDSDVMEARAELDKVTERLERDLPVRALS